MAGRRRFDSGAVHALSTDEKDESMETGLVFLFVLSGFVIGRFIGYGRGYQDGQAQQRRLHKQMRLQAVMDRGRIHV